MKKLVAGILVVALMLTLGSAFAYEYEFVIWDHNYYSILECCDELDNDYEKLKKAWVEYKAKNQLGDAEVAMYRWYHPELDTYNVNTICDMSGGYWYISHNSLEGFGEFIAEWIEYCIKIIYSPSFVSSAASVAKEVSKDGKVTIYAAPSKDSTKLASAVSYYDCQIFGTADVDGATWTKVNYVKEDVEGWILTK